MVADATIGPLAVPTAVLAPDLIAAVAASTSSSDGNDDGKGHRSSEALRPVTALTAVADAGKSMWSFSIFLRMLSAGRTGCRARQSKQPLRMSCCRDALNIAAHMPHIYSGQLPCALSLGEGSSHGTDVASGEAEAWQQHIARPLRAATT